jgi:hypothetical protein
MNNFFTYLVDLNIILMILYVAFKLFFEKDKNFTIRRIYLLGVLMLPVFLPMLPASVKMPLGNMALISVSLDEITIFGSGGAAPYNGHLSLNNLLLFVYMGIITLGIIKVLVQLVRITVAILHSKRFEVNGIKLVANPLLHASSFFGYIFLDPASEKDDTFSHILEHENSHKREYHSIDRILVEIFVIMNWFNPVAWMLRRSVIENLEYLADSAVLRKGTDPAKYQLSILNQYIGSASISNQFSRQIKNRINMLNKNYKLGSRWKLALLIPLVVIALFVVSCTDKDAPVKEMQPEEELSSKAAEYKVFNVVEEMPIFKGEEAIEFRRYIAQNLIYPPEAAEAGATGRIFITFIVDKEGKVVIPDQETLARIDGKPIDEVVVVGYRAIDEDAAAPEEKYIEMLKKEVIRVVSSSPDWTPGRQRGEAVNVLFTFPINFVLQ